MDQAKASEGWNKLTQIVEDYKKAHNGASVYAPTFIEDCEPAVKKLQEEYGFEVHHRVREVSPAKQTPRRTRHLLLWLTGVFFCMSPFRGYSFTVFPLC